MTMKLAATMLAALILLSPLVAAADDTSVSTGAKNAPDVTKPTATSAATTKPSTANIRTQVKEVAADIRELKVMISERAAELNKSEEKLLGWQKNVVKNENKVRLAVHTFIAMENLTGGIGKNVSAIAREFNNSVQVRERLEEKIHATNPLVRFIMGGERKAATELFEEVNRTTAQIQKLKDFRDACDCTDEVKAVFNEQMAEMEAEQTRLAQLARTEMNSFGLLGWLFK